MIYDYRQDRINLINHTENNEQSLSQTLYCLQVISKALLNGQYLQKPLNDILQNKATSELSDSKTSKQIPSETKDETTTTKSPLKIIKIRWVHHDKPTDFHPIGKHIKKSKENNNDLNNDTKLDFDLHGQTVNVLIGDSLHEQEIRDLIESHHGTPIITDAFIHSDPKKILENALNSTDIVILVQNLNKHSTSKTISTIIKNQNIKFAISNSAGIQSIERAIYRADQELPAYESMGSEINYPVA